MDDSTNIVFGLLIGIGLSAACGFRVFVPLLLLSIFAKFGKVNLSGGFDWIGSWPAIVAFGTATVVEVGAYYIPWVDNALDSIAGPLAVAAGVLVTAALIGDVHPVIRWGLAIIAGGGAAGAVQGVTTVARAASTVTTAGIGNPVVSTAEGISSVFMSILAILLPVIAVLLFVAVVWFGVRLFLRRRKQATARTMAEAWRTPPEG